MHFQTRFFFDLCCFGGFGQGGGGLKGPSPPPLSAYVHVPIASYVYKDVLFANVLSVEYQITKVYIQRSAPYQKKEKKGEKRT